MAGGVFSVGDEDDDAAGIGCRRHFGETLAGEGDGVVECGGVSVVQVTERGVDAAGVVREGCELGDFIGERDQGDAILRAQQGVEEGVRGGALEALVGGDALAGVDGEDDVERGGGGWVEVGDALRPVVFAEGKVGGGEVGDGSAVRVGDVECDGDEVGVEVESGLLSGEGGRGCEREECERAAHEIHRAVPGRSSGKGSPSAQAAPSTNCSFFQMGTVFLRVSMTQRQASKAAPRWAEATAMKTLVSPTTKRPSRWTMATSRTAKCSMASERRRCICCRAISS